MTINDKLHNRFDKVLMKKISVKIKSYDYSIILKLLRIIKSLLSIIRFKKLIWKKVLSAPVLLHLLKLFNTKTKTSEKNTYLLEKLFIEFESSKTSFQPF